MISVDDRVGRQRDLGGDMFLFHLLGAFMLDFLYQLIDIDIGQIEHGSGFIHPVQDGNVLQQHRQSGTLRITAFDKEFLFVCRQIRVVDDCFQISLDTADRSLQFVGDILRQLSFHPAFFLLTGNIVDRDFVTVVEEHHTFNQKDLPAFIDGDRLTQDTFVGRSFMFLQEISDRSELFQVQYFFGGVDRRVGNQIGKLNIKYVRQDFLSVVGEHGKAFP